MKYTHTRTEIDRAIKKVEIAIDKLVDLQDLGFGTALISRVLEQLNSIRYLIVEQKGE